MLLQSLVLQHLQKQCCQNHWWCNILKNNVAKSIGFTTFPKTMLLEALVLQHVQNKCCWKHQLYNLSDNENHWFYNMSETNVVETIGFTTIPKQMLLKILVLQHFRDSCC